MSSTANLADNNTLFRLAGGGRDAETGRPAARPLLRLYSAYNTLETGCLSPHMVVKRKLNF